MMFYEQEIIGSIGCKPQDYYKILELIREGKIRLDKLISGRFGLEDINRAFDELREGRILRNIILPNLTTKRTKNT